MKEGRGRGSDGQIMYSQTFDNLYVELGTMIGDRSVLFGSSKATDPTGGEVTYHGKKVVNNKDSVLIRPVVGYQAGNFGIAASMEANLVKNAVIVEDGVNGEVDISDRIGYGVTTNYTTNDWNLIANFAYMDAVDENNMTVGVNALYKGFGLGYIWANNEYENNKVNTNWADGNVEVSTLYASYEFANVLQVEDFSLYLGAYYTDVNNKLDSQADTSNYAFSEDADKGVRVRFKYFF